MRKDHTTDTTDEIGETSGEGTEERKPPLSGANFAICVLSVVACAVVLGVSVGVGTGRVSAATDDDAAAQSQLAAAQQALDDAKAQASAATSTADVAATQGLDVDQVTEDTQTITKVLSCALTWDSKASYDQAREDAVAAGLPADSELMSKMMPEIEEQTDQWDKTVTTNRIDELGLNSTFDSADVRPWSKDGDAISYVVLARADTREGEDGDPATTTWLVRVTCDDGRITSADAQSVGIVTEG